MPDLRARAVFRPVRPSRRAELLALVIVATAAAAALFSSGSPPTAARAVSVPAPASSSERATPRGGTLADASASPRAVAAPRHAVVHTMSMDAPIQGGLTAHQEQARSARLVQSHRSVALAPRFDSWTPAMGVTAAARAASWLGMPYSWAGGNATAPTAGRCDPTNGGDLDCHVVGFDCSGLTMYAWGPYVALAHLAATQTRAGAFHPTLGQLLPGDLVFFSGYLPAGTGHVAIYAGHGRVIEAPQSGSVIRRSSLAHLMAHDGVYRGAVRPMTGATPTLSAPRVAVSSAGGTVTLRGAHLAGVDAVHLGGVTVQRFERQSDSVIVFRAPAHGDGTVALTVSTSWRARSAPVNLAYAKPRPAPRVVRRKAHAPTTPPLTLSPPTSPTGTPTTSSSGSPTH